MHQPPASTRVGPLGETGRLCAGAAQVPARAAGLPLRSHCQPLPVLALSHCRMDVLGCVDKLNGEGTEWSSSQVYDFQCRWAVSVRVAANQMFSKKKKNSFSHF